MKTYIGVRLIEARECIYAEAINLGIVRRGGSLPLDTGGYLVKLRNGATRWIPELMFRREFAPIENMGNTGNPPDASTVEPCLGTWAEDFDVQACVEFMYLWADHGINRKR